MSKSAKNKPDLAIDAGRHDTEQMKTALLRH
jgi:hypothetical protein